MEWPDGFMWGTGASSTQCEGAAPASDWIEWERAGNAPESGKGNGFSERYAEDFAILADLGLTHHRLSIEWARIEPAEGERDPVAIAHYRAVLQAAIDAGVDPWVTLHHFTLPTWFADKGAFAVEENRTTYWNRHIDFIAETFGDLARGWKPINEANIYARIAYRGGRFPPAHDDRAEAAMVTEAIYLAKAEAAVRLRQTGAPVSSIFSLSPAVALDEEPETLTRVERLDQEIFGNWINLVRDGRLEIRGREPVEREDLVGCFDLIGFSYYATIGVRDGQFAVYPDGAPISPLGYGIWSGGVGLVLDRLAEAFPDTPLLVAEYGVGTDDDGVRERYIEEGLAETRSALDRGIDVRGFFHWTATDNYEWLHGYDVKFGLMDADRKVRPSAAVLAREARSSGA